MGVCISGELVVRFLHENKLNSEIFNEFINKNVFLCQFKLRIQLLLKDGMRIKGKKICKLWGFTEKSAFMCWFIKKR